MDNLYKTLKHLLFSLKPLIHWLKTNLLNKTNCPSQLNVSKNVFTHSITILQFIKMFSCDVSHHADGYYVRFF